MLDLYISKNYIKFIIGSFKYTIFKLELQYKNKNGHDYGFDIRFLDYKPKYMHKWFCAFRIMYLRECDGRYNFGIWFIKRIVDIKEDKKKKST